MSDIFCKIKAILWKSDKTRLFLVKFNLKSTLEIEKYLKIYISGL